MDKLDEREKLTVDVESIYKCIGEFVVKFELISHSMTLCIHIILERSGLRRQRVAQVLIAGMTTEPLRTMLESLASETGWLNSDEKVKLRTLMARVQKLTLRRNEIVHGAWMMEFNPHTFSPDDVTKAFGYKLHKNKDGAATKNLEITKADFAVLIDEANDLRRSFERMYGKLMVEDGKLVAFLPPPGSPI